MFWILISGKSELNALRDMEIRSGKQCYYVPQFPEDSNPSSFYVVTVSEDVTCKNILDAFFRRYPGISSAERPAYIQAFSQNYGPLIPSEALDRCISFYS